MQRNMIEIFRKNISGESSSLSFGFAGREQCMGSHSFGPAKRAHYLIHFIIKGKGVFFADEKKYVLKQRDMFLIRPGETTFYYADEEDPWEYGSHLLEATRRRLRKAAVLPIVPWRPIPIPRN